MRKVKSPTRQLSVGAAGIAAVLLQGVSFPGGGAQAQEVCARTVTADVVALDQPFFYNRFGSVNPAGMIYALRRDVVDASSGQTEAEGATLTPGNVALREDKRPRPIVLRANIGDCLQINFENLLAEQRAHEDQPVTRAASIHVMGMEYANDIGDDGGFIGANPSSLVDPGESATYTLRATHEGTRLLYNQGVMTGAEGDGGTLAFGLFGAVNILPEGAEWYRSQVSHEELALATVGTRPTGHPIIDYDAVYPAGHRLEGLPILNLLDGTEIVHSEVDAIITGPNRGDFPAGTYPPNPILAPNAEQPPALGAETRTREEPFREYTLIFHDEIKAVQAFPEFRDPVLGFTLASIKDGFGI
ncbi:MAG TPA: hypothetical protein VHG92_11060, partial [Afifellaceae bacterium]|nr:hypothetical protein [Afifellaceae bacterium]